eukprot:gene1131-5672_t
MPQYEFDIRIAAQYGMLGSLRRESTDLEDMFIAHIGGMDTLARGLRGAARLIQDGVMDRNLKERYQSWRAAMAVVGGGAELGRGLELAITIRRPQTRDRERLRP